MVSSSNTEAEPFLVVGWRSGVLIECRKLPVHESLFKEIRDIANKYINQIVQSDSRSYDPAGELEAGEEYFRIPFEEIPARRIGDEVQAASLLEQLPDVGALRNAQQQEITDMTLLFYGFAFQQGSGDDWLTLIRKVNPTTYFRAGRYFCTASAALKKVDQRPTFAFDDSFDLAIRDGVLYATSSTALKQLFTEVNLSAVDVEGHVEAFVGSLPEEIKMPGTSVETLVALAARKKSCIARVYGLSARMKEITSVEEFSLDGFTRALADKNIASEMVRDGEIRLETASHAEAFLDAIEGRYFPDVWTNEALRADRMSKRR